MKYNYENLDPLPLRKLYKQTKKIRNSSMRYLIIIGHILKVSIVKGIIMNEEKSKK